MSTGKEKGIGITLFRMKRFWFFTNFVGEFFVPTPAKRPCGKHADDPAIGWNLRILVPYATYYVAQWRGFRVELGVVHNHSLHRAELGGGRFLGQW